MTAAQLAKRRAKKAAWIVSAARIAQAHRETMAILEAGRCPDCGAGLHANLALTGWYQCDRFGAPGFRKDNTGAECSWQGFAR